MSPSDPSPRGSWSPVEEKTEKTNEQTPPIPQPVLMYIVLGPQVNLNSLLLVYYLIWMDTQVSRFSISLYE